MYLNGNTTINYTVFCANGYASYYQPGYRTTFYATRNNQTIFVGPGGWTRN